MITNKDKLLLLKNFFLESGISGSLCAIYNNIENKWYYYIGELTLKNPNEGIYFNKLIRAKCLNKIIENEHMFFRGDNLQDFQSIILEIERCKNENYNSYDFLTISI